MKVIWFLVKQPLPKKNIHKKPKYAERVRAPEWEHCNPLIAQIDLVFCRYKFGNNFTYKKEKVGTEAWKHTESFTIIAQPGLVLNTVRVFAIGNKRDFDLLEENLGIRTFLVNSLFVWKNLLFSICSIAFRWTNRCVYITKRKVYSWSICRENWQIECDNGGKWAPPILLIHQEIRRKTQRSGTCKKIQSS